MEASLEEESGDGTEEAGLGGWVWLGVAIGLVGAAALVGLVAGLRLVRRRRRQGRAPAILAHSGPSDAEAGGGGGGQSLARLPSLSCLSFLPAAVRLLPSSADDLNPQSHHRPPTPDQTPPDKIQPPASCHRQDQTKTTQDGHRTAKDATTKKTLKRDRTKRRQKAETEKAATSQTSYFSVAVSRWRSFMGVPSGRDHLVSVGVEPSGASGVGVQAAVGPCSGVSVGVGPRTESQSPVPTTAMAGSDVWPVGTAGGARSEAGTAWRTASSASWARATVSGADSSAAGSSPTSTATAGSSSSPLSSSLPACSGRSLTPLSTSSLPAASDEDNTLTPDSARFVVLQPQSQLSLV